MVENINFKSRYRDKVLIYGKEEEAISSVEKAEGQWEENGDRARRLKSELDVMWPELWICTGDQHTGDKLFKTPEIDSKPYAQGQESRLGSQNWEFSVGKIRMRTKRIRMRTVWEHVKVDMKEPQTLSKVHGKPDLRSLA